MKTHPHSTTASGFTLAEVTIAMGIAAGALAIIALVMGGLGRSVQLLKPYEAWKKLAFVNSSTSSSSNNGSTSSTNNGAQTSSTPAAPTKTLPDANLDPSKRPSENTLPPDPDDPAATKSGTTGGTSGTTTP